MSRTYSSEDKKNAIGAVTIAALILLGMIVVGISTPNPISMLQSHVPGRFTKDIAIFIALVPISVLLLEFLVHGWKECAIRRLIITPSASARIDILCHVFFNWFSFGYIIFYTLTYAVFANASHSFRIIVDLKLIETLNPVTQFCIYFIVRDFFVYWTHRCQHIFDFLWYQHSVHHSANKLNVITVGRINPLEELWANVVSGIPLALLGTPVETFMIFTIINQCQQNIIHSNLQWDFGWVGRWLVVSPKYHQIHHSIKREHQDSNFSTQLVVWDKIFGTFYNPGDETASPDFKFGVNDAEHNKSFIFEIWYTTKRSLLSFIDSLIKALCIGCYMVMLVFIPHAKIADLSQQFSDKS